MIPQCSSSQATQPCKYAPPKSDFTYLPDSTSSSHKCFWLEFPEQVQCISDSRHQDRPSKQFAKKQRQKAVSLQVSEMHGGIHAHLCAKAWVRLYQPDRAKHAWHSATRSIAKEWRPWWLRKQKSFNLVALSHSLDFIPKSHGHAQRIGLGYISCAHLAAQSICYSSLGAQCHVSRVIFILPTCK